MSVQVGGSGNGGGRDTHNRSELGTFMLSGKTYVPGGSRRSSSADLPLAAWPEAASASRFHTRRPLVRSMQKSAIIRWDLTLPWPSSTSHMPVTPRCMPPREEKASPSADAIRRRGEKEIRCDGKKAGGSVLSGLSSTGAAVLGPAGEAGVKRSLREKSAPCQGSAGAAGGGSTGAETLRGTVRAVLGKGGSSAGILCSEVEGAMRFRDTAAGGAASGGGRQKEPADDDGVIAHEVASLHGEFGRDPYGDAEPDEEGDGGHSARSSRSAHGSRARGRARAAAARSAMSNGLRVLGPAARGREGPGTAFASISREVDWNMVLALGGERIGGESRERLEVAAGSWRAGAEQSHWRVQLRESVLG